MLYIAKTDTLIAWVEIAAFAHLASGMSVGAKMPRAESRPR